MFKEGHFQSMDFSSLSKDYGSKALKQLQNIQEKMVRREEELLKKQEEDHHTIEKSYHTKDDL